MEKSLGFDLTGRGGFVAELALSVLLAMTTRASSRRCVCVHEESLVTKTLSHRRVPSPQERKGGRREDLEGEVFNYASLRPKKRKSEKKNTNERTVTAVRYLSLKFTMIQILGSVVHIAADVYTSS